ncbi:hypothetical protein SAMN05414139_03431 [Burkholderia sp. D7]|nr:hypothetical protein SAMN05414139_03431 [Burkholderia sp. D7]
MIDLILDKAGLKLDRHKMSCSIKCLSIVTAAYLSLQKRRNLFDIASTQQIVD